MCVVPNVVRHQLCPTAYNVQEVHYEHIVVAQLAEYMLFVNGEQGAFLTCGILLLEVRFVAEQ